MKLHECNGYIKLLKKISLLGILLIIFLPVQSIRSQSKVAHIMMGRFWTGMVELGNGSIWNTTLFFPNDYDIMFNRLQYTQANNGMGVQIGVPHWIDYYQTDTTATSYKRYDTAAVFNLIGSQYPQPFNKGVVTDSLLSYSRYKISNYSVDGTSSTLVTDPQTVYNQAAKINPTSTSADQLVTVTNKYIYDITVQRKALAWGQNFNDNYVIFDMTFTNVGTQTYDSLYLLFTDNMYNVYFSNGSNPQVASGNVFKANYTWQHYYGARPGDSLRVYYEYSADDPDVSGDQMGAPAEPAQQGRLTGYLMNFMTVLHASQSAYTNSANDVDDPLEPKITFAGNDFKISSNFKPTDDPYGSSNFWAIKGGFADRYPIGTDPATGNVLIPGTIPAGTHHGVNTDEMGKASFADWPAGQTTSNQSLMHMSFGPYSMAPGQKIHIVYACGVAGLNEQTAKAVGYKWLHGTLQDPDTSYTNSLPNWNPNTGLLPPNFVFPTTSKVDQSKDKWISLGIDSVMLSAWRAKWNYDHGYKIPVEPPPPSPVNVKDYVDSIQVQWSDAAAEPNFGGRQFVGYRIQRRISNYDTLFYQTVYDSDSTDVSTTPPYLHSFADTTVRFGVTYYYYVQAKWRISPNDLNADPTTRGKIIYSNRLWVQDNSQGTLPAIAAVPYYDDMSKIRIVPNPYNANDPAIRLLGSNATYNVIKFWYLPSQCTIKIYTENGDLVKTIYHPSRAGATNNGGEEWNLDTSYGQIVNSGVYIAVFQKPNGQTSYQKFIIVR